MLCEKDTRIEEPGLHTQILGGEDGEDPQHRPARGVQPAQVEETMDALSEGPERLYKSCLD